LPISLNFLPDSARNFFNAWGQSAFPKMRELKGTKSDDEKATEKAPAQHCLPTAKVLEKV